MTENKDCQIVRSGAYNGKQGFTLSTGISTQSAGSTGLCLHTLTIPAGSRARAHRHVAHESAIYLVSGEVEVRWGESLEHRDVMRAGDFVYIPPGTPHLPVNPGSEPATAVVARTDPNEQESVELLPELDAVEGNSPRSTSEVEWEASDPPLPPSAPKRLRNL